MCADGVCDCVRGSVEVGEQMLMAAAREVYEETTLDHSGVCVRVCVCRCVCVGAGRCRRECVCFVRCTGF